MNTEKHTYLIEHIFKTFFPGVEYVVEPENSLNYLYNIRLTNVLHKLYDPNEFVPRYKFENVTENYSELYFENIIKDFASSLTGLILIYYKTKDGKSPIILTPNQTKHENYGIVSLIKDPHRHRFDTQ
jgi:hypothetical protein